MPWTVGQLFDHIGPHALPPTIVALALLTAVVGGFGGRLLVKAHRA
jgi:hypothetical protein